jgi:hypothetical protein
MLCKSTGSGSAGGAAAAGAKGTQMAKSNKKEDFGKNMMTLSLPRSFRHRKITFVF